MAQEIQYTANTGIVTIATANANLDGTGTLGTVLTAGANGTIIKTIIIKAQVNTTEGMVRLFVRAGGSTFLLSEVHIPIVTKSSRDFSYYNVIPMNYALQSGDILLASTEKAETFNVIAEGLDYAYGVAVREDSTEYNSITGSAKLTTANTNLDGTGTLVTVLTSKTGAPGYKGCMISSILIKAQATTTPGMVRLYIKPTPGATATLFTEVFIPAITQNATNQTFMHQVIAMGSLSIQSGYIISASTEKGEPFSVVIEGSDWFYP